MKLAIIRTSSIGDAVLASACLDYLQQVAPEAEVTWLGRAPSLKLIQLSWPSVKTIDWNQKSKLSSNRLLVETLATCDAVIDLQTSHRSRRLCRKLKARGVRVFSAEKFYIFRAKLVILAWFRGRLARLSDQQVTAPRFQFQTMLETLELALSQLGYKQSQVRSDCRPRLSAEHHHTESSWLREMAFGRWLAVSAGASYPAKRAPTDVFQDILMELAAFWPKDQALPGLVFLGGADDRSAALALMDQTHWAGPVINLAGKLSLEDSMLVLSKAQVLLSNDSGLAHIMEALGKPVAVLFGPTIEAFGFPPHRSDSRVFSASLGCRPCSKHGKRSCRYDDHLCFRSIDVRAVARYLRDVFPQERLI